MPAAPETTQKTIKVYYTPLLLKAGKTANLNMEICEICEVGYIIFYSITESKFPVMWEGCY